MIHKYRMSALCLAFLCILIIVEASANSRFRRQRVRGRTNAVSQNQYRSMLRQLLNNGMSDSLREYMPSTPRPQDVNCYVEVPSTRVIGGRCIRLNRQIACQAGEYMSLNTNCTAAQVAN